MTSTIRSTTALLALAWAALAHAAATPEQVASLSGANTPLGTLRAGNSDGSIPAWDGGLTKAPAGFDVKQGYPDPFAGEQPVLVITKANAGEHADKLSVGQKKMLERFPDYRIKVYPSHRTAALPEAQYKLAREGAAKTVLAPSGNGVVNGQRNPRPFLFPTRGEEVLWNHSFRYRGGSANVDYGFFIVEGNGNVSKFAIEDLFAEPTHIDHLPDGIAQNTSFMFRNRIYEPAAFDGVMFLAHDKLNQDQDARAGWQYNVGQRRVKRVPDLCCDFQAEGFGHIRNTDLYDFWNGPTNRYEWKLLGAKEMYVPYNNYRMTSRKLTHADFIGKGHVNPDLVRYEKQRVWVVEGTLRSDQRHFIAKRTMYVEQDSAVVVLQDIYDAKGGLWRIGENYVFHEYTNLIQSSAAYSIVDLNLGAYIVDRATALGRKMPTYGKRISYTADLTPDALRRFGTK